MALCENTGQSLWLSQPRPFGGYVTFGVKILAPDGRLLDDTKGRQLLPGDVPPGGRVEEEKEVTVYYKVVGGHPVLLTVKARCGKDFLRGG